MNTIRPFVLISAAKADRSASDNAWRHRMLARDLRVAGFRPVAISGAYEGTTEQAFLIASPGDGLMHTWEDKLLALAAAYAQDSILYVDANRGATLMFPDGRKPASLGQFRRVSPMDAQRMPAYSLIDGEYYVAS